MLVSNTVYKNRYVANGTTTSFPISFPFLDNSHILVLKQVDENTTETVDSSLYTVTGAGVAAGGSVKFKAAPTSGIILAIVRNVPITQLYQYTELDNFPAKSHENSLAKLTMISQELKEETQRAIKVPVTSTETPEQFTAKLFTAADSAEASQVATAASQVAAKASELSAAASKTAAAASSTTAATMANNASISAGAAKVSETASKASETAAAGSEASATNNAASALASKEAAAISQTAAAASEAVALQEANRAKTEADRAAAIVGINVTETPVAGGVPKALGTGKIDRGWVPDLGPQAPTTHATTHGIGGADPITSLGPVAEKSQALGTISGSVTINLSAGLSISATIGGATTLAFTGVPTGGAAVVVLTLTNGGSATVTWPTTIAWASSKAPTLTAAGKDMIVLATSDGGASWMGSANLKYGAGA